MHYVALRGGLGNQMFQYAHARACAGDQTVIINLNKLSNPAKIEVKRNFGLNNFLIGPVKVIDTPESGFTVFYNKVLTKLFPHRAFFQSERYFKKAETTIRKEFTLKEPLNATAQEWKNKIEKTPISITLHVRRGDYVTDTRTNTFHGVCGVDYYQRAIKTLSEKLGTTNFEIFAFSDDLPWIREHLKFDQPMHFVSTPAIPDYQELVLMSYSSHQIIANSSYSWWGAWLNPNPNKIVIAPKKWFAHSDKKTDIIPESWIQL